MHGVVRWHVRLFERSRPSLYGTPLSLALRHCATIPTEDDVRKAYKILGVQTTATLSDVKKRYGDLAKEHHPDVSNSSADSSTNRMMDINDAYNTVKQFHQAGRRLFEATQTSSSREAPSSSSSSSSYYTKQDREYQPWYEDMDPLMYELMWEEMRRQNEEGVFARSMGGEGFHHSNDQWRPPRDNPPRPRKASGQSDGKQSSGRKDSSSTTWPEEQVKAMVNMYQDGKSFEFIANALGKESAAAVVEEFNRWSSDNKPHRRRGGKSFNAKRHRPHGGPSSFYYTESPDEVPFELYEMMEDGSFSDGSGEDVEDSFGYFTPEEEARGMQYPHPTPFYGMHQMSGGPAPYGSPDERGGRGYGSSRKVPHRSTRHHRSGSPNKNRRFNATSSNNRGSGGGGGFYPGNGKSHSSGGGKK